jgi:hypothetical protein
MSIMRTYALGAAKVCVIGERSSVQKVWGISLEGYLVQPPCMVGKGLKCSVVSQMTRRGTARAECV